MGFRHSFAVGLAWRVGLLFAAVVALDLALRTGGLVALPILAAGACAASGAAIWAYLQRISSEVARFVEAIGFGDLSQGFRRPAGSGFAALGQTLDDAMKRLRDERAGLAEEGRFNALLVDEAPLALLTVGAEGRVALLNKQARRMFGGEGGDPEAFAECGSEFVEVLRGGAVGRRVVSLVCDGMAQRVMLSVVHLTRLGGDCRLIAVSPIQHALTEAELAAQSDLVRVLTHEIMNSLTPVTSLARSVAGLMAGVDDGADDDVGEARRAVDTLARRADALMGFVESYRQFARVPQPRRRRFDALGWAEELARLFSAAPYGQGVPLAIDVRPPGLAIDGDADLLSQVAINLLKNAAEAAAGHAAAPAVRLSVERLPAGHVAIAVEDNGPGVAEAAAGDIFLPFFTTKPAGSGVGLSVARQIVLAHQGTIAAGRSALGGASLRIVL